VVPETGWYSGLPWRSVRTLNDKRKRTEGTDD
jgi:hypothetical protein